VGWYTRHSRIRAGQLFLAVLLCAYSWTGYGQLPKQQDSLLQVLNTGSLNPSERVGVMNQLSLTFHGVDDLQALEWALSADSAAQKINDEAGQARALNLQSAAYSRTGKIDLAIEAGLRSQTIAASITDTALWVGAGIALAKAYRQKGFFDEAVQQAKEAREAAIKAQLTEYIMQASLNLGVIYDVQVQDSFALFFYRDAIEKAQELQHLRTIANCHNNIGNVLARQLNPEAKKSFELALETYRGMGLPCLASYPYSGICSYFFKTRELDSALFYTQKMVRLGEECEDAQIQVDGHLNSGTILMSLGRPEESEASYRESLRLAELFDMRYDQKEACEGLYLLFKDEGEADSALAYHERFITLRDSIYDQDMTKRIARMEADFDAEMELKELEAEQQIQTAQLNNELSRQKLFTLLLGIIALALVFIGWGAYRLFKTRQKNALQAALIAEKERGMEAVFQATEKERSRIAKDIHDGIGQQLSALKMQFQQLQKDSQSDRPEKLQGMASLIDDTAREARDISHEMMPVALGELGLVSAIEEALAKSFRASGMQYHFEHFNLKPRYSAEVELVIYRVFQELVNNVLKHSQASEVNVQLYQNQGRLLLHVEDNGVGFDPELQKGFGLLTMQNRIDAYRGKLNVVSSRGSGTSATASLEA